MYRLLGCNKSDRATCLHVQVQLFVSDVTHSLSHAHLLPAYLHVCLNIEAFSSKLRFCSVVGKQAASQLDSYNMSKILSNRCSLQKCWIN